MASPTSDRIKRFTLVACILGSSIAMLDATIVNVALPTIERDFGGGFVTQQWVVDAYALLLGALLLVGGSLGDVYGERRIFAIGVAGFALTSAVCALAPSAPVLIGARAVQGVAGALLTPAALAVIIATFPVAERGAAIGTWTAFGAVAAVAGPLAGGGLLAAGSWRFIFLVNLPLAALTLTLITRFVPPGRAAGGRHLDLPGAALAALGLAGPVFALIEQPRLGWGSPSVVGALVGGLALLAGFVWRERRARDPMLPLSLFARHNFTVGNLETLAMYCGMSVLTFLLSLYLQEVGRWSPVHAGLATLPLTVVMFVLSRRFGALADRFGPRFFMGAGPLVCAAGLLLLMRLERHVAVLGALLPGLIVFALGLAMTVAPLTATVLGGVPDSQAGIASAVNNAVARVAGLLGVSALGPLVAGRLGVSSFHTALAAAAVLLALAGGVGGLLVRNPERRVAASGCAGGQIAGAPRDMSAS